MHHAILYLFPLAFDIIVSVSLFVGRHSLAEKGVDTVTVGSILTAYGLGYIISSLLMGRIIRPTKARYQMMVAVVLTALILILLSQSSNIRIVQILFLLLPFAASFFFNAYQTFMLSFDSGAGKPLTRTIAHYTGAWSIGFALGPLVASFVKKNMDWPSAYLTAALVAAAIGIAAFFFRSPKLSKSSTLNEAIPHKPSTAKSLAPAAWIGVIGGWTALNMIFTYWPVQAESYHIDIRVRGAVEFAFAMSQSLVAFALASVPDSYYYSKRLPFAGLLGMVSLLLFALGTTPFLFVLSAVFFGAYTAHILNSMVFHSMVEKEKAVKRVSINEVCVGISFFIAAPIAGLIWHHLSSFTLSYLTIALFIGIAIMVQSLVMRKLLKTI